MHKASPQSSWEGRVLADKYRLEHPLGAGGMGTVWAATHLVLGTTLAIKLIRREFASQPEARERFEIEARAAAQISSRHAVAMYDHGVTDDGIPYLVMEYLEGESLADYIIRCGALSLEETCEVIQQAARALEQAHERGIVHRDLKPDNFFLATNCDFSGLRTPYVVKLVDFGIAKLQDTAQGQFGGGAYAGPTKTGMVIGTPSFMSPEQLASGGGKPDHLVDIWALGCTAFTAVCARIPFEGEVLGDIVLKVCAQPLPKATSLVPDLLPEFDAWFERACARDRAERFQSVGELTKALFEVMYGPAEMDPSGANEPRARNAVATSVFNPPPLRQTGTSDAELPAHTAPSRGATIVIGAILGVSIAIAIIGYVAVRAKEAREAAPITQPTR